jgi:uncharacterized glyoxalase superfamily protein PhnB
VTGIAIKSLAPILLVESIEPSLPFWVEQLGFSLTVTVPDAAPLAFAIVARDCVEVMLQSRASAGEDLGDLGAMGPALLYISVAALEPVLAAIEHASIVVPRRTTFYGSDEIYVRDPAGNVIGFSAPG